MSVCVLLWQVCLPVLYKLNWRWNREGYIGTHVQSICESIAIMRISPNAPKPFLHRGEICVWLHTGHFSQWRLICSFEFCSHDSESRFPWCFVFKDFLTCSAIEAVSFSVGLMISIIPVIQFYFLKRFYVAEIRRMRKARNRCYGDTWGRSMSSSGRLSAETMMISPVKSFPPIYLSRNLNKQIHFPNYNNS